MLSDFAILIIIIFMRVVQSMNLSKKLSRPLVLPPKVCCEQSEWPYNLHPLISSLDGNVPAIWNFCLLIFGKNRYFVTKNTQKCEKTSPSCEILLNIEIKILILQ